MNNWHTAIGVISIVLYGPQLSRSVVNKRIPNPDELGSNRMRIYFGLDMALTLAIWDYRDIIDEQNRTRIEIAKCEKDFNIARLTAAKESRKRRPGPVALKTLQESEAEFIACILNRTNRNSFYRLVHKLTQTVEPLVVEIKEEVVTHRERITIDHKMRLVDRMVAFRKAMMTPPTHRHQLIDAADIAMARLNATVKFPPEALGPILHRISKQSLIRRAVLAIDEALFAIDYVVPCWPGDQLCASKLRNTNLMKCLDG